ncbi:unnamed protein product [Ilex paraguariensis]|uniref:Uncharacterized protein n=1 Tax=Ilex paraguariensis TaxID=185542 RepID=A0ABC8R228_9AQUA
MVQTSTEVAIGDLAEGADTANMTPATIPTSAPVLAIDSAPLVPQANVHVVSTKVPPNNADTLSAILLAHFSYFLHRCTKCQALGSRHSPLEESPQKEECPREEENLGKEGPRAKRTLRKRVFEGERSLEKKSVLSSPRSFFCVVTLNFCQMWHLGGRIYPFASSFFGRERKTLRKYFAEDTCRIFIGPQDLLVQYFVFARGHLRPSVPSCSEETCQSSENKRDVDVEGTYG